MIECFIDFFFFFFSFDYEMNDRITYLNSTFPTLMEETELRYYMKTFPKSVQEKEMNNIQICIQNTFGENFHVSYQSFGRKLSLRHPINLICFFGIHFTKSDSIFSSWHVVLNTCILLHIFLRSNIEFWIYKPYKCTTKKSVKTRYGDASRPMNNTLRALKISDLK